MSRDELEGFILSNSKRRQIVNSLEENEELTLKEIAKKKRIPKKVLRNLLDELVEKEIVIEEDERYSLSELGEKIVADSHRFEDS